MEQHINVIVPVCDEIERKQIEWLSFNIALPNVTAKWKYTFMCTANNTRG